MRTRKITNWFKILRKTKDINQFLQEIEKGLSLNGFDPANGTILHQVYLFKEAELEKLKFLTYLAKEAGIDIEHKNMIGSTAINTAPTIDYYPEYVNYLIDEGTDIFSSNSDGHTVLTYAALCEKYTLVEKLIQKGMNIKDVHGKNKTFTEFTKMLGKKETNAFSRLLETYWNCLTDEQKKFVEKTRLRAIFN